MDSAVTGSSRNLGNFFDRSRSFRCNARLIELEENIREINEDTPLCHPHVRTATTKLIYESLILCKLLLLSTQSSISLIKSRLLTINRCAD
jgi:hypothetical protein